MTTVHVLTRQVMDKENYQRDKENVSFYKHMLRLGNRPWRQENLPSRKSIYRREGCAILCITVGLIQDKILKTIIKHMVAV